MKRWLSVMGILAGLALVQGEARAVEGVNLSWDNCGAAGTANKNFACDTNTGTYAIISSFVCPDSITLWNSVEVVIDIKSSTDPLPDWWRLRNQTGQLGQCRNGSLSANADFSTNTGCVDQWSGQGGGGLGTYRVGGPVPLVDNSRVRLTAVFAIPAGSEQVLTPDVEYYAIKFTVNSLKTVGTGAQQCAGCLTPMSLTLNGVKVVQAAGAPSGNEMVTDPAVGGNRTITWQGGAGAPAVPAHSKTWGQVKSLYR